MSLEDLSTTATTNTQTAGSTDTEQADATDLDKLRRENAHLRQQYAALRSTQYQRTVLALAGLGAAGLVGAALFPPVQQTLVVLGAIGLFGAAVTRYLTPEQLIPIDIGESVFGAHALNHAAVVDELGLQDTTVFVPDVERETTRLFVPERRTYTIPSTTELRETFVISDDESARGVAFTPSGIGLFDEFERRADSPLANQPTQIAQQVTDALTELFELVDNATAETDEDDGRLTFRVTGCRFGSAQSFDTPVASFIGVAVARALDTPIEVETVSIDDEEFTVTCRWETDEGRSD